ncbi:nicotinate-nucleotide--dimethylbenzimidazole phosphoribosyltransferase [Streptomyces formicae]|uniref:Nicotinate-nucleotide--dimethylbenzimidazole phosphoribosyltransferase n=1 Tax=Streptomyces formicae TaxID=1616117 RepID=A0ABY3WN56_9ACTN|nr:nicotinate-nucleotide--dimethylbenzimidazole phosphoribosyltransferase [Streptomyces formicae]UNM14041.1 nicotinate-nucleotide--dimethylbenzimidazole phosphoribosyltransferase [Streptomyces formicae]
MTDTGQIPGEGLPENAGMVEQPGIPAPGAYTFLDPSGSGAESVGEEDDLLLMPGAQGAWSEPHAVAQAAHAAPVAHAAHYQGQAMAQAPVAQLPPDGAAPGAAAAAVQAAVQHVAAQPVAPAPEPAVAEPVLAEPVLAEPTPAVPSTPAVPETPTVAEAPVAAVAPEPVAPEPVIPMPVVHEPVTQEPVAHEPAPEPVVADHVIAQQTAPEPFVHEAGAHEAGGRDSGSLDLGGVRIPPPATASAPTPPRRPLHMGPPVPDATGGVVRSLSDRGPADTPPHPMTVRHPSPPTTGPEYLDVPREEPMAPAAPQVADVPAQAAAPWSSAPGAPVAVASAETVVPEPVEALATAAEPAPVGQFVPVEGSLPTTPHLAPTPVAVMIPAEEEPAAAPEPEAAVEESAPALAAEPEPEAVALAVVPAPRGDDGGDDRGDDEPAVEAIGEPEPLDEPAEPQTSVDAEREPEAAAEPEAEADLAPVPEPEADVVPEPEAIAEPVAVAEPVAAVDDAVIDNGAAPAPGYDHAEREAVLRVMRERRDIRNGFRSDPIPHEVLLRVLEAAHTAPSVGHSQPWDFVVIRSAETRRTMHELAQRQREAYAKSLPKGRAKQFKELKIEAILETPVNIVVTADPTRGGRHTLGRHTQPQMAPYSSALAVENLWLAARAEGLGVGWVSFFDEREMVRALGLPEHLEVVAYLCVGYVDEFPEEPELMQAGWSKRRPLAWVVHEETYGRRALPGEEPHDLLQETVANIRPLDAKALGEAWERQKRMTKPAGALGMLEIISAQLAGLSRMCPPPIPEPAAVAIFAGDHGVHAQGVTAWPQEVTGQMVANFLGGGAVCNAFANQVGAEVCVIDVGVASELPATPGLLPRKVRPGTADFTTGPALSREEVLAAIEVGIETARDLVAAGNKALLTGEMGIANTTVSAALISVYTGVDPVEVTGRGTGINDEMHARKVDVVRRALELHRPDPADPVGVLAAVGGLEHAALVGFILGAASLRTPVVLDGVSAGAAALVARAVAPEALAACIAGHRSAEPGHVAALNKLGLRPLVDLDLRLGEGTGALLALPVVQSAARAMHEVATFDSAGVTEK